MQGCHEVFNLFMCTKRPLHSADSLTFLHRCIRLAESPCAPPRPPVLCVFCWQYFVMTGFTQVSLSASRSVRLPPLISVCLPPSLVSLQFDITASTLCRSAPHPRPRRRPRLSVHSSVSPSAFTPLDVFRMRQKSCEPLYLFFFFSSLHLYRLSFSPLLMFSHQSGAGSEKAVHLDIAGDGQHVPVNTRPLAMLSHLVSSLILCWYFSNSGKKKFQGVSREVFS